ncbi:MAG: glycosyl hydrolase family 3, partial [Gemmatimonadetes bacterium]|nr:glycosyl hydrolase family 3 [Gemmatimonadota bacterium]
MNTAALLMPSLRHDATHGFAHLRDHIDDCLELGVGGFLIYGGSAVEVGALAADLRARSRINLLLAADVERGVGQQFAGCLALPPFGALGSLGDVDVMRRAARITARELKQLGLNWAFAPVCDLDVAPYSPIVGTRAIGDNAPAVAAMVAEWIDACQAEGVLACAKHFPGHGRADGDSHVALPTVFASADQLWTTDLLPFRAAIDAGVASMMTAHVAYPSLDPGNAPATLSHALLTEFARRVLEFDGLFVSDALEMDGVLAAGSESEVAIAAVAAGCDVLLAPMDVEGTAQALAGAS